MSEHQDAAFLGELMGFLDEYDASITPDTPQLTLTDSGDHRELLLSSHHLIQETETLLASLKTSTDDGTIAYDAQKVSRKDDNNVQRDPDQLQDIHQTRSLQAAQRRLRYRQKVKDERKTLKKQEMELSTKLNKLLTGQSEARKREAKILSLNVWKIIAIRQMDRRFEAEVQQKRLRAEVVSRARKIHQMNKMLLATSSTSQADRRTLYADGVDDDAVLKTYLLELDSLYAKTDKMRRGVEFKISSSIAYNLAWKREHGVDFLENADATIVPFNFERTCIAMSTLMFTMMGDFHYYNTEDPENTSAAKCNIAYNVGTGETVNLVMYLALRRFNEDNRVVYVWRSLTEGQGEFDGIHSDETTWLVIRPCDATATDSSSRSQGSATILEFYGRMLPVRIGGQEKIGEFIKIVSKMGDEETKEATQMLDRLLLAGP